MFEDQIPENAIAARQPVAREADTTDRDYAVYESEVRIARSVVDSDENRITREQQRQFGYSLRKRVRELLSAGEGASA